MTFIEEKIDKRQKKKSFEKQLNLVLKIHDNNHLSFDLKIVFLIKKIL